MINANVKLKTLKDLKILKRGVAREDTKLTNLYYVRQVGEYKEICYPEQLRNEAIKWIKDDNIKRKKGILPLNKIEWIKHFFDITEEDL